MTVESAREVTADVVDAVSATRNPGKPQSHVLYRMRDAEGALLYVGITASVEQRLRGHRGDKGWWSEIASIDLEHFPSRYALEAAEKKAVRDENPVHNLIRFAKAPAQPCVTNEMLQRAKDFEPDDGRGPKLLLDREMWESLKRITVVANGRGWEGYLWEYMRWFLGESNELGRRKTNVSLKPDGLAVPQPGRRLKTVRTPKTDPERWERFKQGAVLLGSSPSVLVEGYFWWWLRAKHASEPQRLCAFDDQDGASA